MRALSSSENASLDAFTQDCSDHVLIHVTATGLAKSTIDATKDVRDFLYRTRLHNYTTQARGPENKAVRPILLFNAQNQVQNSAISFNRPRSGNGDPRLWISLLNKICVQDNLVALALRNGRLVAKVLENVHFASGHFTTSRDDSGDPMTTDQTPTEPVEDWWDRIGNLWDRATGGADVAARPHAGPEFWETSPRPAGVEAATTWFKAKLDSSLPTFIFLVGGPGAGKSHTAAELVVGLEKTSSEDAGLANRSYDYRTRTGRSVRLVNDATIPNAENQPGALMTDIDHAITASGSLIACVNRGVLIEERISLRDGLANGGEVSRALLQWLAESQTEVDADLTLIEVETSTEFLRVMKIVRGETAVAEVVAVSVDVCSLLEKSPVATFTGADDMAHAFESTNYVITDFTKRSGMTPDEVPALDLIDKVVCRLAPPSGPSTVIDPIAANLESLSKPSIQQGFASILRGAEVVSAQRMTYREIWGAVTRAIVGGIPQLVPRDQIEQFIRSNQPDSSDPIERFRQMSKLAELRYSQAIFASEVSSGGSYDPVLHLTSNIDPVLDARPGKFQTTDWSSGWSTPITDAFDTPIVDATPLDGLGMSLPKEDCFHAAVTGFDSALDEAYAKAMLESSNDAQRFQFSAQYGAYLTRLYAVANGITAFRPEVTLWTRTRLMVPKLPDELAAPLRTLLRPKRRPESNTLTSIIPVFDSRTDPIIGRSPQPRFGLRTGGIQMKTQAQSDEVILTLSEDGDKVASVTLDFVLVREALACDAERPGITDLTESASPRLERFRSARLISSKLADADFCALIDDREIQVSVSDS